MARCPTQKAFLLLGELGWLAYPEQMIRVGVSGLPPTPPSPDKRPWETAGCFASVLPLAPFSGALIPFQWADTLIQNSHSH